MVQLKQSSLRNRLLRALALEEFALVGPHLEQVALPRGKVLIQPYQPIENVIFPESGVASVVALSSDNRPVEIGIVGREGLVGPSVMLGVDRTPHQSFFQMEGDGYRIPTPHLIRALAASSSLHDLLLRYIHVLTVQTAATAMPNGDSVLSERMARWLLMRPGRRGRTGAHARVPIAHAGGAPPRRDRSDPPPALQKSSRMRLYGLP